MFPHCSIQAVRCTANKRLWSAKPLLCSAQRLKLKGSQRGRKQTTWYICRIGWKGTKSNPSTDGGNNNGILTVDVWDQRLRLSSRPWGSQDHQGVCGPVWTPHFPHRSFVTVGRQMSRGKHSWLHTRGLHAFPLFRFRSTSYGNPLKSTAHPTCVKFKHFELWDGGCEWHH